MNTALKLSAALILIFFSAGDIEAAVLQGIQNKFAKDMEPNKRAAFMRVVSAQQKAAENDYKIVAAYVASFAPNATKIEFDKITELEELPLQAKAYHSYCFENQPDNKHACDQFSKKFGSLINLWLVSQNFSDVVSSIYEQADQSALETLGRSEKKPFGDSLEPELSNFQIAQGICGDEATGSAGIGIGLNSIVCQGAIARIKNGTFAPKPSAGNKPGSATSAE